MLPSTKPAQIARSTSAVAILPRYCAPLMRMVGRMNTWRGVGGSGAAIQRWNLGAANSHLFHCHTARREVTRT